MYSESVFNTLYNDKTKNALFFFCELQLITVLLLIWDSYMS